MTRAGVGRLYGVGVGPGDPELITLKAHRLLTSSPVICVPVRKLGEESYAETIVRPYLRPESQEILRLEFPMSRDWERLKPYWERNAAAIWQRLQAGRDCLFVTEGDPMVYSTFIYLYEDLRRRQPEVQIEVVPGISSFLAAAARTGTPLGNQEERIAIIPEVKSAQEAREILTQFDTVVFLKISASFDLVYEALESLGLLDEAAYVKKVSAPGAEEVVTDIRTLRGKRLEYLSLLLVRRSHDR